VFPCEGKLISVNYAPVYKWPCNLNVPAVPQGSSGGSLRSTSIFGSLRSVHGITVGRSNRKERTHPSSYRVHVISQRGTMVASIGAPSVFGSDVFGKAAEEIVL